MARYNKPELFDLVLKGLYDKAIGTEADKYFDTYSLIRKTGQDRTFNQIILQQIHEDLVFNGWAKAHPNKAPNLDLSYHYEIREEGIKFVEKYQSYSNYLHKRRYVDRWKRARPYLVSAVTIWVPLTTLFVILYVDESPQVHLQYTPNTQEIQNNRLLQLEQRLNTLDSIVKANLLNHHAGQSVKKDFCHSCEPN